MHNARSFYELIYLSPKNVFKVLFRIGGGGGGGGALLAECVCVPEFALLQRTVSYIIGHEE